MSMSNVSDAWGRGRKGMNLGQASGCFIHFHFFKRSFPALRLFIISFLFSPDLLPPNDRLLHWLGSGPLYRQRGPEERGCLTSIFVSEQRGRAERDFFLRCVLIGMNEFVAFTLRLR